jgi:transposase-like protein
MNKRQDYNKNNRSYQAVLDKIYGGTVRPIDAYINPKAIILHECSTCGLFYAKPTLLVYLESQMHKCNERYDILDNTTKTVTVRTNNGKGKVTDQMKKEMYRLASQGKSISYIAGSFSIDRSTVSYHLKRKGIG